MLAACSSKTLMATSSSTTTGPPPAIDPNSGFFHETRTFHSLRPAVSLPTFSHTLSFPSYFLSLLPCPLPTNPAIVNATTGDFLTYPDFLSQVRSLSSSFQTHLHLSKGQIAFILSPSGLDVPVLYCALLSIGAIVCPANPTSTPSEISHQFALTNPSIAFATSTTSSKLPPGVPAILLDSAEFRSFLTGQSAAVPVEVLQSDTAAIQFSSGTTGRVKAAALSHRCFISTTAGFYALRGERGPETTLLAAPMFHSFGFMGALNGVALGETVVVVERFGLTELLGAVEKYRVTLFAAAPPLVVAMAMARSEEVAKFDLGTLRKVLTGGAPLAVSAAEQFMRRFPDVELCQGYGMTEAGGISRMIGPEECKQLKSVGLLSQNVEAKIVDITTGEALSVDQHGELWVRGPAIMTGYIGDQEANAHTFSSEGWLKTGDLCYFNKDGYLFIVDRLKEMIKYKAYQVPPAELELLLQALPEVADAAVIPYPDEEVGQIPMAFVVRKPGSHLTEQQVISFVAKQVAPYKKIRRVAFVNAIPKSPSGKILRRKLVHLARSNSISKL